MINVRKNDIGLMIRSCVFDDLKIKIVGLYYLLIMQFFFDRFIHLGEQITHEENFQDQYHTPMLSVIYSTVSVKQTS